MRCLVWFFAIVSAVASFNAVAEVPSQPIFKWIEAYRSSGFTDEQIYDFLGHGDFGAQINKARSYGYTEQQIVDYLGLHMKVEPLTEEFCELRYFPAPHFASPGQALACLQLSPIVAAENERRLQALQQHYMAEAEINQFALQDMIQMEMLNELRRANDSR